MLDSNQIKYAKVPILGKGGSGYIGGLRVKPACRIIQNLMAIVKQLEPGLAAKKSQRPAFWFR